MIQVSNCVIWRCAALQVLLCSTKTARMAAFERDHNQTPIVCAAALQVLLAHDDAVKIEGASVGEKWLVVAQRSRAQQTVVTYALPPGGAMPTQLGEGHKVEFDEPAYTLSGGERRP